MTIHVRLTSLLPARSAAYRLMRLHQPIGIALLFWPCAWALIAASQDPLPVRMLLVFLAGAVLMRSAGCIINDIWDRKLDAQVERTRLRPLASGEVGISQAVRLLGILLVGAALVAVMLGKTVLVWSAFAVPLVAIYPVMKRVTWWPQAFLGLTFNWGVLLGWVAVMDLPAAPAWWLYAGGVLWTVGYDTIYAHQDKHDDARAGIKSTARFLGEHSKAAIAAFYAGALACWGIAGHVLGLALVFWLGWIIVALHMAWQLVTLDIHQPESCHRVFKANNWTGCLLAVALSVGVI